MPFNYITCQREPVGTLRPFRSSRYNILSIKMILRNAKGQPESIKSALQILFHTNSACIIRIVHALVKLDGFYSFLNHRCHGSIIGITETANNVQQFFFFIDLLHMYLYISFHFIYFGPIYVYVSAYRLNFQTFCINFILPVFCI